MFTHYLKIALKVLARRKFFTAVSLFGIAFTLVVLTVATAITDHAFSPMAPEVRQDRTLLISRALGRSCPAGDEMPSMYSASATRRKSTPTVPQSGFATLFPSPPMGEADSRMRSSSVSIAAIQGLPARRTDR